MLRDYLPLSRRLLTHWLWESSDEPFCKRAAWVDLLFQAAYAEHRLPDGKVLQRGEFLTSQVALAKKWGWSRARSQRFLRRLETEHMIEQVSEQGRTRIKILNYERYNNPDYSSEHPSEHPSEHLASTKRAPSEHNRRREEGKKERITTHASAGALFPEFNSNGKYSEEFIQAWNSLGEPFSNIRKFEGKRLKALRCRRADPWWVENWRGGIERIKRSRFCRGEGGRGWVATVDWFLRPDSLTKIFEGQYDDRSAPAGARPTVDQQSSEEELREWCAAHGGDQ